MLHPTEPWITCTGWDEHGGRVATTLCSSPRSTPAASSPSQPNPQHVSPPTSARRSALPTTR